MLLARMVRGYPVHPIGREHCLGLIYSSHLSRAPSASAQSGKFIFLWPDPVKNSVHAALIFPDDAFPLYHLLAELYFNNDLLPSRSVARAGSM